MSRLKGVFIETKEDESIVTYRVVHYSDYNDMISDPNPPKYGICDDTNKVYCYIDSAWVEGFDTLPTDWLATLEAYVTTQDKANWNGKADASTVTAIDQRVTNIEGTLSGLETLLSEI